MFFSFSFAILPSVSSQKRLRPEWVVMQCHSISCHMKTLSQITNKVHFFFPNSLCAFLKRLVLNKRRTVTLYIHTIAHKLSITLLLHCQTHNWRMLQTQRSILFHTFVLLIKPWCRHYPQCNSTANRQRFKCVMLLRAATGVVSSLMSHYTPPDFSHFTCNVHSQTSHTLRLQLRQFNRFHAAPSGATKDLQLYSTMQW